MGKKFGEFLKSLREKRGLTLREVEQEADISNAYLSQIERGFRGIPNFSILERLADAYWVPLEVLAKAIDEEKTGGKPSEVKPIHKDLTLKFVSRGIEKLSVKNKEHLMEYLRYLLDEENRQLKKKKGK